MAKKPETKFKEDKVHPFLESLPRSWCEKIQQVTINGTPDFLCCINGHFVAIELKKSKYDKESKLQKYKLARITKAGGISIVVSPEGWEKTSVFLHTLAHEGFEAALQMTQ